MGWCTTSDLDRFVAVSASYLNPRAAENTLLMTATQAASAAATAECGLLFGWWQPPDGSGPRGAFLHDPSAPLLIAGRTPELAAMLAGTLAKSGRPVCGVDAPVAAADAFAAAWSQRSGVEVRVHRYSLVYRLVSGDAAPADRAAAAGHGGLGGYHGAHSGRLRAAAPADHELLTGWLSAFAAESGQRIGSPEALADDMLGYGGAAFWEVPHRASRIREAAYYLASPHHRDAAQRTEPAYAPVAMAAVTRPVAGAVRISVVYTVPERRRNGYATAVTLAMSRAVLAGGDPAPGTDDQAAGLALAKAEQVVLITERNRPDRRVSRLGYQLVGERVVLRFGPPTGPLQRLRTGPLPRLPTGPLPRLRRDS